MAPPPTDQEIARIIAIQDEEKRNLELYRLMDKRKRAYVRERTNELLETSVFAGTPMDAQIQAAQEFEEDFMMPLQNIYGELPEKVFQLQVPLPTQIDEPAPPMDVPLVGGEPNFVMAMRPQTRMEPSIAERESARIGVESSIDFAKLEEAFIEREGMDADQAALQRRAIQRAYEAEKSANPTQTPDEVFERVVGELEALSGVLEGEGPTLEDQQGQRRGPADPVYQTFVRQRQAGQPVPDLSRSQIAYFDVIYKQQQEDLRSQITQSRTGEKQRYYRQADGSEVLADAYDLMAENNPEFPTLKGTDAEFIRELPAGEAEVLAGTIQAGAMPDLWWADPEKKPKVLANPEDYTQLGIFSSTTPYGGQVETPVGWLLRSALIVPNTIAGVASEEVIAPIMLDEEGEKERVERRPELYKDSPVLLNIAENRGFTMEMNEAADIMDYGGGAKFAATAVGFGLDLLDPSFGMVGGAMKGTKTAVQMTRARRAIYGGENVFTSILKGTGTGVGEGINYFNRDINFFRGTSDLLAEGARRGEKAMLGSETLRGIPTGDVRMAMAADLAGSLEARALAREADTAADATRAIDEAGLGQTTYSKELQKRLADIDDATMNVVGTYERVLDDTDKVITAGTGGSRVADNMVRAVDDFDAVTRSLDEIVGSKGKVAKTGKTSVQVDGLAENLGALAKRDGSVENIFRAIDEGDYVNIDRIGGAGERRLFQYVRALDEMGKLPQLRRQFAYDKALGYVVENTPFTTGLDKFRMVTPNTFATTEKAAEILNDVAQKTEIGAIGRQFAELGAERVPIVERVSKMETRLGSTGQQGIQRKAEPAFDLSNVPPRETKFSVDPDSIELQFQQIAEELLGYNKITNSTFREIMANLADGFITTRNYRRLLSGTIDLVAEGKQVALRGKDVSKLPAVEANRLLDPVEMRSFARGTLRKIYNTFIEGAGKTESRAITPAQRQLVKNAQQEASNMDTTLRQGISRLGKKGSDEYTKYGLSSAPASRNQAIGVMIVGERQPKSAGGRISMGTLRQEEIVKDTMTWYMRTMFYVEKSTESVLDSLLGFKKVFQNPNTFLSTSGRAKLDAAIAVAANRAVRDPSKYWDEMIDVVEEFRIIIKDPENLQPRVRPRNIVDVQKANKGTIPAEIQVGSYYWAESQRIMDRTLDDIFSKDPTFNPFIAQQATDAVGSGALRFVEKQTGADAERIYQEYIKARAKRQVVEGRGAERELLQIHQDFYDGIVKAGGDPNSSWMTNYKKNIDNYAADPTKLQNEMALIAQTGFETGIMLRGDDAAHSFVIRNNINTQDFGSTFDSVSRVVEDLVGPENSKFFEAVLGRDALDELQDAVKAGKTNNFARYVDSAIRSATGKKDFKRVIDGLLYSMRLVNNLRYTILLSARTRFHGANILTAPFITYSTIGQIPNGARGLNVFYQGYFKGGKGRMKTISAPDGRVYTYGEIADGLINAGIRSEFGFITDVATQQRIVAYAESRGVAARIADALPYTEKGGKDLPPLFQQKFTERGLEKTGQAAQDLILAEDMAWRAGVAVRALEEGRSFDEAMNLARRSMFDYNDMTAFEKGLSGYAFIFYAFARQNFATLLRNLIDPAKGWKRITNVLKTERGLEALANTTYGTEMVPEQFYPDYMNARITYRKIASKPDRDVYTNGPPIPPIDAMVMLGTLMKKGGYSELLQRQLHPTFAQLLNVETFKTGNKQLRPEHAALISLRVGNDPVDIANYFASIVGGEVTPVPSTDSDAIDGYKYPLSPEQQKNYKTFERWALQFTGLGSMTTDYARLFSPEGTTTQDLSTFERFLGFGTAFSTPIRAARPAQVSQYDIRSRIEAINKRLREIDEEEKKER